MIVYNICLFIDSFIFFLILRQSGTKISETLSFFLIILPAPPPPLCTMLRKMHLKPHQHCLKEGEGKSTSVSSFLSPIV